MSGPADPFTGFAPVGTTAQAEVAAGRGPARLDPRTATLGELARELAIFNHGCLMTHGGLAVDPAEDYCLQTGDPECRTFALDLPFEVFCGIARGAAEAAWDRRLMFIHRRFWPGLMGHLAGVAIFDRAAGRFGRATVQVIAIVDRLALLPGRCTHPYPLPVAMVTCFGYDGSDRHVTFASRTDRAWDRAQVIDGPVDPVQVRIALALRSPDADPAPLLTEANP